MTEYREQLLDDVIRKYGFEVDQTIRFAEVCETARIEVVEEAYMKLMKGERW